MSVGRLTGSGAEAARRSRAQRTRADRAAAGHTTAERTTAERTTAERAEAEGTTAEHTAAEQTTAERTTAAGATAEGAADGRAPAEQTTTEDTTTASATAKSAASERTTAERTTAERTTAGRTRAGRTTATGATAKGAASERTTAGRTTAAGAAAKGAADGRAPAEQTTTERTTTASAAAEGAAAGHTTAADTTAGRGPAADASARRNADPASNVVVMSSHTGPAAPAASAASGADGRPAAAPDDGLFARYTREYVTGRDGQQVTILEAGCTTADDDLGVGELRGAGADIVVSLIDDDRPVTSAALGADQNLADCVQADLRTVPLPPRSQDIVLCALLLQRIQNAELVLDRLVAAIKPGGLLLLHFGDRDSAAGFLDRVLPTAARRAVWRRRRPGQPGPYPAVYERVSSARGVQAYALMRELVIAERRTLGGLEGTLTGPAGYLAAQKLIAWASRGRLTAAHEELLYVLRKPEDRFARIL